MDNHELAKILDATPDVGTVKHIGYAPYVTAIQGRPYMNVDGRIAMATTDHRNQSATLDMMPAVVMVNDDRELTLAVTIRSSVYGERTGTATSHKGGRGIEAQHPWEIAETSAIGRALATFGYGLLPGSGLASAEDMERALNAEPPAPSKGAPAAAASGEVDWDGVRKVLYGGAKLGSRIVKWPGPMQSDFVELAKREGWDKATVVKEITRTDDLYKEDPELTAAKLAESLKVPEGEAA